ncbi:hypothetical protein [Scytonema sp. UIC 10036]|nr:hypothetical protein [Scytonema sp. UIC 10036]
MTNDRGSGVRSEGKTQCPFLSIPVYVVHDDLGQQVKDGKADN